jgi:hypothetical protein
MQKWQPKLDPNDIKNFLPDNEYIGTSEFWNEKFNGMLPDGMSDVLEAESRKEHDEIDVIESVDHFKNSLLSLKEQIELELRLANLVCYDMTEEQSREHNNTPSATSIDGLYDDQEYRDMRETIEKE